MTLYLNMRKYLWIWCTFWYS